MNKEYKFCPYCGKQIHEISTECIYCGEVLKKMTITQKFSIICKNIIEAIKYDFTLLSPKKIFRRDINLNKKWRHILIKISFILWIIIVPIWKTMPYMNSYNRVEVIDKVENRLGNEIKLVGQLLKFGEYLENDYEEKGLKKGELINCDMVREDVKEDTYCSQEWNEEKLNDLLEKHKVIRDFWYDNYLHDEYFAIKENKCITIHTNSGVSFLNQFSDLYQLNQLYILTETKKSKLYEFWYVMTWHYPYELLFLGINRIIVVMVYYIVVLRLIYGPYKKDNYTNKY